MISERYCTIETSTAIWFVLLIARLLLACWLATSSGIADPTRSTLTLLGDSIMQAMVRVQLSLPPPFSGAANLALPGLTVAQIGSLVPAIPVTATHVLIEGGVNDLLHGNSSSIIPSYVSMLQTIPSDKHIILIGILPVDEEALHSDLRPLVNNTKIAAINARLAALCATLPNCMPASSVMAMNMMGKTIDGIHLKAAAYKELADRLGPICSRWQSCKPSE